MIYMYLVGCPGVAEQSRGEVGNVSSNLLNHHLSHLTAPYGLGCVKLTQEDLTELVGTWRNWREGRGRDGGEGEGEGGRGRDRGEGGGEGGEGGGKGGDIDDHT